MPAVVVTQLFMTMIAFLFIFRVLKAAKDNKFFHLAVFTILGVSAIPLSKIIPMDPLNLVVIRTMFSVFFVYLGYYTDIMLKIKLIYLAQNGSVQ